MSTSHVVKARRHYGSKSLNLTIPAEIRRELEINVGDVFIVEHGYEDSVLILKYKCIYKKVNK